MSLDVRGTQAFSMAFQGAMSQGLQGWGQAAGQLANTMQTMQTMQSSGFGAMGGVVAGGFFTAGATNMNTTGFMQQPQAAFGFAAAGNGQMAGVLGRVGGQAQMLGTAFGAMGQMAQQVGQQLGKMVAMFQMLKGAFQMARAFTQMAGMMRGAKMQPQKPQLSAQDKKVQEHINKHQGKWLVGHGQYNGSSQNQKEYTFKTGIMKGYKATHIGDGHFSITNSKGMEVGEWEAPGKRNKVASPVAFDLNRDGKIGTTGETTAKDRKGDTELGRTVKFDIDGDGKLDEIEWMNGDGDGLLVDDRDGRAAEDMSGKRLYGDEGGKYEDGYKKLAKHDVDGDGKLTGEELKGLKMWVDDGDAKVEDGEMKTLEELGIKEISVRRNDVKNDRGETLMRSTAETEGGQMMTEDVWFGQKS